MKSFKMFAVATIITMFATACNDETDVVKENNTVKDVEVMDNGSILKFKDQETFNRYVKNETTVEGFYSLYNNFTEAMDEAESYYEREGGYEEFKAKYSFLYFPEYEDDYSAYLPVSDKTISKYVNLKGQVLIGDCIKNYKDIITYSQLSNSDNSNESVLRSGEKNGLETTYNTERNRKIWVETYRRAVANSGGQTVLWVEVCFRKKGFLGKWYNYWSQSTITSDSFVPHTLEMDGESSHDYSIPVALEPGRYWPAMNTTIEVHQRGMDKDYSFTINYPREFCKY